jgi:phage shock protein E
VQASKRHQKNKHTPVYQGITMKKIAYMLGLLLAAHSVAYAKTVVIDVRTPGEYAQDHVRGALNIDHSVIGRGIGSTNIAKDDTVILYCRSGNRSGAAQRTLQAMGFTHVENYGGLDEARKRLEKP